MSSFFTSKFIFLFMDTNTPKNQKTEYWISLKSYSDNGMRHNVGLFPLQFDIVHDRNRTECPPTSVC